jgi:hypothetical protein
MSCQATHDIPKGSLSLLSFFKFEVKLRQKIRKVAFHKSTLAILFSASLVSILRIPDSRIDKDVEFADRFFAALANFRM